MFYRINLLRGLQHPTRFSYQLGMAEKILGLWSRIGLLLLVSCLIYGMSAFFGVGTESLSREITELSIQDYETHKALFALGQIIWGLLGSILILFIPSLFFWAISDAEYKRMVVIQLFVLFLFLLEKIIFLPFQIMFGLQSNSSPFSLGIIGQYLTSNTFLIHLLATISIFKVWAIYIQFTALKELVEMNQKLLLTIIIFLNLFFWLLSALFSYIEFEKVL
jgi:hypothetical protein